MSDQPISDEQVRDVWTAMLGRVPSDEQIQKVRRDFLGQDDGLMRWLARLLARREELRFAPLAHTPGHFYSPITHPDDIRPHFAALDTDRRSVPGIHLDHRALERFWRMITAPLDGVQPFPDDLPETGGFGFLNPAFTYGDATALHCVLRHAQPRQVIEVGSGYSSLCLLETRARFLSPDCQVTFIEPNADLLKRLIRDMDAQNTQIREEAVQNTPVEMFEGLRENDILFIDSTHILKTGSDVVFELSEVLPRIHPGVYVHFHDIFWPFEYPDDWAVDLNRSWNEIYALRAFLTENPHWEIVVFNDYLSRFGRDVLTETTPWNLKRGNGSIWLRRLS